MSYFYIALTIMLTVYGQIVVKWQLGKAGAMPASAEEKILFLLSLLLNPWVLSSFAAAFLAALAWMATLTQFELSYAYPYMGLVFALLLLFSAILFHEPITWPKLVGTSLIVLGVVVGSQG